MVFIIFTIVEEAAEPVTIPTEIRSMLFAAFRSFFFAVYPSIVSIPGIKLQNERENRMSKERVIVFILPKLESAIKNVK